MVPPEMIMLIYISSRTAELLFGLPQLAGLRCRLPSIQGAGEHRLASCRRFSVQGGGCGLAASTAWHLLRPEYSLSTIDGGTAPLSTARPPLPRRRSIPSIQGTLFLESKGFPLHQRRWIPSRVVCILQQFSRCSLAVDRSTATAQAATDDSDRKGGGGASRPSSGVGGRGHDRVRRRGRSSWQAPHVKWAASRRWHGWAGPWPPSAAAEAPAIQMLSAGRDSRDTSIRREARWHRTRTPSGTGAGRGKAVGSGEPQTKQPLVDHGTVALAIAAALGRAQPPPRRPCSRRCHRRFCGEWGKARQRLSPADPLSPIDPLSRRRPSPASSWPSPSPPPPPPGRRRLHPHLPVVFAPEVAVAVSAPTVAVGRRPPGGASACLWTLPRGQRHGNPTRVTPPNLHLRCGHHPGAPPLDLRSLHAATAPASLSISSGRCNTAPPSLLHAPAGSDSACGYLADPGTNQAPTFRHSGRRRARHPGRLTPKADPPPAVQSCPDARSPLTSVTARGSLAGSEHQEAGSVLPRLGCGPPRCPPTLAAKGRRARRGRAP
ncbi:hypothetical protein SETIT_4G130800v2 [Setaria italica]|uniref:Uncharacterized protein n=1 Tax=Setaria italica TaxID=4555 RepID=A0A368QTY9_SETIT|nr:hypothetical protein SETIT_4G130800v2 [Setaria italica]